MNRFNTTLLLLVVGIVLCTAPAAFAQTKPDPTAPAPSTPPRVVEPAPDTAVAAQNFFEESEAYGVGLNLGFTSGAGLSGRFSHPVGFVGQLTFMVMSFGEYFHYNVGIEGQYGFIRSRDSRFYGLLGGGFYSSTSDDSTKPGNRIANPVRFGFGLGYEYFLSRQFVMSFSGAVTVFPKTGEVYPLPEIGFFFYFR